MESASRRLNTSQHMENLHEHEEFSRILENAAMAVHLAGPDGTILWANAAELSLLGYARDEYVGHNITEFHVEETVSADILHRLATGVELHEYEARLRAKDGSIRYVSISSNVYRRDGRFVHTRCFTRDITEHKRAAELQEWLAAIVESSDDAIVSKDLNGIIQSWNRGAERIFGYTADEVIGKPVTILAAPDRVDEFPDILSRIRRNERIDHYQTKRKTKDGRILTVSLSVSPIRDASGAIIGASKIVRDVTEQKHTVEVQERLAAIVESSDDAIISKDLNGIIQSWNSGAQRMFGYTADEIIGKPGTTLAVAGRVDEIPIIIDRIRRGERVEHYETLRRSKDGRVLTVSLTVSPIRDASGVIIGASKIARDITERARSQEALRETNAALTRANADLEQFAYSASHDLREPLRMVSTYSQMIKRKFAGQLGAEGDEFIRHIVEGTQRMQQLLKDILAYTQASTHDNEPASDVDANEALEHALSNLYTAITGSGASIRHTPLPVVRMHQFQLEQVFQNLIANAIRYRREEPPQIQIEAVGQDSEWLFSVRDNGIGIEPQYQEHIFGMFKRLHSAAEYPGSGMGLAICHRIVHRAGGRIWVESEPGQGSTFFFTVPASQGH